MRLILFEVGCGRECSFVWWRQFGPLQLLVNGVVLASNVRKVQGMVWILNRIYELLLVHQLIILWAVEFILFIAIIDFVIHCLVHFALDVWQEHPNAHLMQASVRLRFVLLF